METIKNYLDSMFANLPNSASVLRAKEELLQMMEDKYTELRNEGKTENEAVGNVIAEFGNLDELAEALGVEEEVKQQYVEEVKSEDVKVINTTEAGNFISMKAAQAKMIALGVAVIILSVICPILVDEFFVDQYEIFGAIGMFVVAGIGVAIIIMGNLKKSGFEFVRKGNSTLSMDATKYVKGELRRQDNTFSIMTIIGILLCATSWIPAGLLDNFVTFDTSIGGAILFLMVAIGVFLIIYANISKDGYKILLRLNGKGSMKADFEEEAGVVRKYNSPAAEFIMGVYWPTIVCLYLITSFATFRWGLTWSIFPVAGIIHVILRKTLTSAEETNEVAA